MKTVSQPLALQSWQGRRILALLCAVAFLDFVDASITNVALPHILTSLRFSVQSLLARGIPAPDATTSGSRHALVTGAAFAAVAALIALATTNTHEDPNHAHAAEPQAASPLAVAAPEPITREI